MLERVLGARLARRRLLAVGARLAAATVLGGGLPLLGGASATAGSLTTAPTSLARRPFAELPQLAAALHFWPQSVPTQLLLRDMELLFTQRPARYQYARRALAWQHAHFQPHLPRPWRMPTLRLPPTAFGIRTDDPPRLRLEKTYRLLVALVRWAGFGPDSLEAEPVAVLPSSRGRAMALYLHRGGVLVSHPVQEALADFDGTVRTPEQARAVVMLAHEAIHADRPEPRPLEAPEAGRAGVLMAHRDEAMADLAAALVAIAAVPGLRELNGRPVERLRLSYPRPVEAVSLLGILAGRGDRAAALAWLSSYARADEASARRMEGRVLGTVPADSAEAALLGPLHPGQDAYYLYVQEPPGFWLLMRVGAHRWATAHSAVPRFSPADLLIDPPTAKARLA